MAKKTITPAPATPAGENQAAPTGGSQPAQLGAAAQERARVAEGDVFKWRADLTKGAPQAKGIVNILKAASANGLKRTDLVAAMNGVIQTKQPMGRILSYYQKDLENAGAVTIERASGTAGTSTGTSRSGMSTTAQPTVPVPPVAPPVAS